MSLGLSLGLGLGPRGSRGGLYGAGSAAGAYLGSEPSGLALVFDQATPNALVRGGSSQFSGSPDDLLTYTAPSPKLVYDVAGVLRYAPHNLLTYSEAPSDGSYAKTNVSVSGNVVTDTSAAIFGFLAKTTAVVAGSVYQSTIWITKDADVSRNALIRVNSGTAEASDINLNTVTGVIASSIGTLTMAVVADGNDWKCTFTGVASTTSWQIYVYPGGGSSAASVSSVTIPKMQLTGYPAQAGYMATTSAARYGLPYDYDPITHAALGILVEEQRTNLQVQSKSIGGTGWTAVGGTGIASTLNESVAPDGTTTMSLLTGGNNGASRYEGASFAVPAATDHTFSCFIKAGSATLTRYAVWNGGVTTNFGNVTVLWTAGVPSTSASVTASNIVYQSVGNGIYRMSFTANTGVDTTAKLLIYMDVNGGTSTSRAWGAQLEAGAFATSYIPTVASQVTRAADQISLATSAFAYSATAGTIRADFEAANTPNFGRVWELGPATDFIYLIRNGANASFAVVVGSVAQADYTFGATSLAPGKAAVAWAANDFAASLNGAAVVTDTSGSVPTNTSLNIGKSTAGGNILNGHIKTLKYLPRRASNSELQALAA